MDYAKVVPVVIAFLVATGVGAMVLFEVLDSPDALSEELYVESTHADTTNASAWSIELDHSPTGTSGVNVTCVNISAGAESYPTFTLNRKTISVAADAANNFTQVNITYTPQSGEVGGNVRDMGETVWGILPIIALVLVASVILGIIITMGSGKKW
jgi:hypothetical protein